MCGIAGYYSSRRADSDAFALHAMTTALTHRGPDAKGVWQDPNINIGLGHTRLSIQDLSEAGAQPMHSHSERFVIVFNGEIYNHLDLRKQLCNEGYAENWRGHSDTETLLGCISAWGLEKTLQSTVGMFALAVWDKHAQVLSLARDRMGEKPLYYGWQDDLFLFGSELSALCAHPKFTRDIDRSSLALLLRHNCIPAPYSIYSGIFKLMPAHYAQIDLGKSDKQVVSAPYWSLDAVVQSGLASPFMGSDAEAIQALHQQLSTSVQDQMIADVPLGAFLSGGIDSSVIAALMQQHSSVPAKTFTIGYNEASHNEAEHAKAVARHLGTEHTELYVSPNDALELIPRLPGIYSEPFSNSSQLPTYLICQLTSQHVKVALDGDGGDELFGGYNRYLGGYRVWQKLQRMPMPLRHLLANLLQRVPTSRWDAAYGLIERLFPEDRRLAWPGDKLHKIADAMRIDHGHDYYQHMLSHWQNADSIVIGATDLSTTIHDSAQWPHADNLQEWMMAMDAKHYIPEDNLVRLDRAAMACSLEARAPLLDHRVVELAWQMPLEMKIRNGQGKWLLREVLYQHVPRELIERPKMGFAAPIGEWLRGPLRDWAEDLLDEQSLKAEGYFNVTPVRTMWNRHLSGNGNHQGHLWDVLMFQAWLRQDYSPQPDI